MASETYDYSYDVSLSFGNNDDNITIWDSTQHSELSGKFVSVVIQLTCECQNTSPRNGTYDIILESTSGLFNNEEIEIGTKTVGAASKPVDTFNKILSSKFFTNNGDCDIKIYFKRVFASISNRLSGNIKGTIKCTVTSEEDKGKETVVGLDKNAITDWFKTLSVDGAKSGEIVKKEFPIKYKFSEGTLGHTLWNNREISDAVMEEIKISIGGNLTNIGSTSKTVDIDFIANGEQTFATAIKSVTVPSNSTVEFNASASYSKNQLPSDGICDVKISITNTEEIQGLVLGQINVECSTLSNAETESFTDDTDIDAIMKDLFGDGYSASDDTDSFMSAYNGLGDNDDKDLLSADQYKVMGMSDNMAEHIQELEARVTALENRLTELSIGGEEVDWYDGGYTGSDDTWGIGDWYKQTDERISQTEGNSDFTTDMLFYMNPSSYINKDNRIIFSEEYVTYDPVGKVFNGIDYSIMLSFDKTNSLSSVIRAMFVQWGAEYRFVFVTDWQQEEIYKTDFKQQFTKDYVEGVTKTFNGYFPASKMSENGDCVFKMGGILEIPYSDEVDLKYKLAHFTEIQNALFEENKRSGKTFVKISGDLKTHLQDKANEEKSKDKDELEVEIDLENFTGSQSVFTYDAQSNNQILQKVEISLAFDYKYDVSQSQLCVGQLLRLDFNTVASHPGFADEVTSFSIGQESISNSEKSSKQRIYKATYSTKSFANNGNCAFKVDFSTPEITTVKLADFKQYFTGKVTGTVKYTTVPK